MLIHDNGDVIFDSDIHEIGETRSRIQAYYDGVEWNEGMMTDFELWERDYHRGEIRYPLPPEILGQIDNFLIKE